jgi:hypothetical protein
MVFAMLPPMPLGLRLLCGVLGAIVTGALNLAFRRAHWRGTQLVVALALAPVVILAASFAGLSSGDRTAYVFLGGLVGIACIRGSPAPGPLADFSLRAWVVIGAAVALGPAMGLVFHYLRYQAGAVELFDDWEVKLSLEDGFRASIAGGLLMAIMVVGSWGQSRCSPPAARQA